MIHPGTRPIEELEAAVQPVGGLDHMRLKIFEGQQPRARTGHKNAARLHQRNRQQVEVLVFLPTFPIARRIPRENELRRIEHHHVPLFPVLLHLARIRKSVGMDKLQANLVQVRIALRLFQRDLVQVHTGHIGGAARDFGVERKAARVAAEIEHARVFGEPRDGPAVVALVAEEPGLVALGKVHFVADAVFADFHPVGRRGVGLFEERRLDAFEATEVVVHVHARELRAGQLVQQRQPFRQALRDAQRINLAQQRLAIPVDHQPAQAVTIGVDQPVGIRRLVQLEQLAAQGDGPADRQLKVAFVDRLGRVAHDAQRDFCTRIEEPATREMAVLVVNVDEVPGPRIGRALAEQTRKNRRLKREILQLRPRLRPRRAVDYRRRCLGGLLFGQLFVVSHAAYARPQTTKGRENKPPGLTCPRAPAAQTRDLPIAK